MYTQAGGAVAHVVVVGGSQAQVAQWLEWAQAVCAYTEAGSQARTEAIARVRRLEAGVYLALDVQGLEDWADAYGWR